MFCENCGRKIPDDTKFCPFCGELVSGGKMDETLDNEFESDDTAKAPKKGKKSSKGKAGSKRGEHPKRLPVVLIVLLLIFVVAFVGMMTFSGKATQRSARLAALEEGSGISSANQEKRESNSTAQESTLQEAESTALNGSKVVFHNCPEDATILVNGNQVEYQYTGTDAILGSEDLTNQCQVRVIAPSTEENYQTAAAWYLDDCFEYSFGGDDGTFQSCGADGRARPDDAFVSQLTQFYYESFLQCINEQDLSYIRYSTSNNTAKISENVFSQVNSKNYYDASTFEASYAPSSLTYSDGTAVYNASFRTPCTERATGTSKVIQNNRTIRIVYEDGVWKVDRIVFLSDDDFNAGRYADLS